jgi:hypothetical protein
MLLEFLDSPGDDDDPIQEKEKKRTQIRAKVLLVSKFMKMFSTLRTEREAILMLKGLSDRNQIPKGLLSQGSNAIKEAIGNFVKAKSADQSNEMRPTSPIPEVVEAQTPRFRELFQKSRQGSEQKLLVRQPSVETKLQVKLKIEVDDSEVTPPTSPQSSPTHTHTSA